MTLDLEHAVKLPDPRYQAKITIYYGQFPDERLSDYSINLSPGGCFIETNRILPVDTLLTVKFNLPGTDAVIFSHARVAWINHPDNIDKSSLPPGMGIQFLSPDDLYLIRDFLEKGDFVSSW